MVLPLFSWFTKYLTPRQANVTTFLASLAQAVHDQVPPDALEPLVAKIANEFVSEASAAEVASAGLAAIREIALRQPLALNETLLQDLVQLRKSKDKGVMMAARGLMSLYRVIGAELLAKKDRGKEATMGLRSGEMKLRKYGEETAGGIDGIELLEQWKADEKQRKRAAKALEKGGGDDDASGDEKEAENSSGSDDDDDDDDEDGNSSGWDISDDSDDSGGWIDVSSEDEATKLPAVKRQRRSKKKDEDDSDEEEGEDEEDVGKAANGETATISKLATTTILTPADLAKLRELRMEASVEKVMGRKAKTDSGSGSAPAVAATNSSRYQKVVAARHTDDGLTAEQIELASTLRKATKEERIALALGGKPSRDAHQSTQAIRKAKKREEGKSMTNAEKARNKNIFMTMGKARAKNRRSLVETRKALKAHVARSKRGGRRGNRD